MIDQHWLYSSCRTLVLSSVLALAAVGAAHAGQESTIFKFDGHDFIRVKTTLVTQDGKPAVNTKLDRNSPAFKSLLEKRSYTGTATLFGQQCDASYAPLMNSSGEVTGALFIGICTK